MKWRLLIAVLMTTFVAIMAGWIYESKLSPKAETVSPYFPDDIDYFLTQMRYRAMNPAGDLDYQIESPRLEHRRLSDISHIETPLLKINRANQQWRASAMLGQFQHQQNRLLLQQKVVIQKQGSNPLQLNSESISFEPDRNLVSADTGVLMRAKNTRIEAESGRFDLRENIYHLHQARAIYNDEG